MHGRWMPRSSPPFRLDVSSRRQRAVCQPRVHALDNGTVPDSFVRSAVERGSDGQQRGLVHRRRTRRPSRRGDRLADHAEVADYRRQEWTRVRARSSVSRTRCPTVACEFRAQSATSGASDPRTKVTCIGIVRVGLQHFGLEFQGAVGSVFGPGV